MIDEVARREHLDPTDDEVDTRSVTLRRANRADASGRARRNSKEGGDYRGFEPAFGVKRRLTS